MNGSLMSAPGTKGFRSVRGRVDALGGDDEVDAHERGHVLVRLVATRRYERGRVHRDVRRLGRGVAGETPGAPDVARRAGLIGVGGTGVRAVRVCRDLLLGQHHLFYGAVLAGRVT